MLQETRWSIPLESRPTVLQVAVDTRGHSRVEHYRLPGLWCLHLYRYFGEVRVNGQVFPIEPGWAGITPPGAALEYRYQGRSTHAYAHFTLPETQPAALSVAVRNDVVLIPAMQSLGDDFDDFNRALESAVGAFVVQPRRAEVKVWEILWQLAERPLHEDGIAPVVNAPVHPAVRKALQIIELRLGEPLNVAALAREVNVSHTHLTRLWHASLGTTVVEHIRRRRVERAGHLLLHSTLPIKAIAARVGIRDLRAFNKIIRRELGVSPRGLRAQQ